MRSRLGILVGLLLLAVGMARPALARETPGTAPAAQANDDCLICHDDPSAESETGRSIGLDGSRFESSVHGQAGFACTDCHDAAVFIELPHPETLSPVDCAICHDAAATAYESGIHAQVRRDLTHISAATCVDCHSTHEIRSATDPESGTYPLNLPQTCGRCHGDPEIIEREGIRIGNVLTHYMDSIHGKAVSRSGLLVAANCSHCHRSHAVRPSHDPSSSVYHLNIPGTCGTCHEGIATQYARGVHGESLTGGNLEAPVCSDCHTAHDIQRVEVSLWQLDVIRECGTCHDDKIHTYRDTFHGQVTALGFVRVATCSDCHDSHDILPKDNPESTISAGRLVATCQGCHEDATESFAQYDPHADKNDPVRNPGLYYTARFMHWLLIGVFSFFGVHTLLWLLRALHEKRQFARTAHEQSSSR